MYLGNIELQFFYPTTDILVKNYIREGTTANYINCKLQYLGNVNTTNPPPINYTVDFLPGSSNVRTLKINRLYRILWGPNPPTGFVEDDWILVFGVFNTYLNNTTNDYGSYNIIAFSKYGRTIENIIFTNPSEQYELTINEEAIRNTPISLTIRNGLNLVKLHYNNNDYLNFPVTLSSITNDSEIIVYGKQNPTITVNYTNTSVPTITNTG